jgi:lauroyl/myristoyl acyltransferase
VLDAIGDLAFRLNRDARRAVEENLLQVLGRPDRRWRWAVRAAFRHGARNYYDTFRIPTLTAADIRRLVPVDGREHLDRALAGGRGAILVGAHLSSLAIGGQAVAARGYRVNAVVEPVDPPELLRFLSRLRAGVGVRAVPLGPRLTSQLLAALRRNEVVGLIVDRDVASSGIPVPFFGRPARLPPGPALLSLRGGAPILPAIIVRRPDGSFAGLVEEPVCVPRVGTLRADVSAITRAVTARLEYYIGKYPEQWTVFQPVWEGRSASKVQREGPGVEP